MRACQRHAWRYSMCHDCDAANAVPPRVVQPYQLTGLQRTYLESHRSKITEEDGPAHDMAADLDDDGVVRFRPATVNEVLDRIVAKWVWEEAGKAIGDVDAA